MSVTVRIPTQLRSLTDGSSEVISDGGTVRSIIQSLEITYPGLSQRIIDEEGTLRRFVNLYVNDEDVRFIGGLDAPVADGGRLAIIPAVAGG